jgi:hypothetical protein
VTQFEHGEWFLKEHLCGRSPRQIGSFDYADGIPI